MTAEMTAKLYTELDEIRYWQSLAQQEGDWKRAMRKEAEAQAKWIEILAIEENQQPKEGK